MTANRPTTSDSHSLYPKTPSQADPLTDYPSLESPDKVSTDYPSLSPGRKSGLLHRAKGFGSRILIGSRNAINKVTSEEFREDLGDGASRIFASSKSKIKKLFGNPKTPEIKELSVQELDRLAEKHVPSPEEESIEGIVEVDKTTLELYMKKA